MEQKRLSKCLAAAGIASRRGAEKLIFDKRVKVNGKIIEQPQHLVDPSSDCITFDEMALPNKEEKVYFLLNKPLGYHCSNERNDNKKIVLDLFHDCKQRLFTVGRLDKNTTGLLIVTNDGLFSQKVIHPSANIEKEYLVKVKNMITHEHLLKLSEGAFIDGKRVKPTKVKKVRKGTFKIAVKEGKKHEIRIITKTAGLNLSELKRIRIGPLQLDALPLGNYRKMTSSEISFFIQKN